jgi:hypothetical protein
MQACTPAFPAAECNIIAAAAVSSSAFYRVRSFFLRIPDPLVASGFRMKPSHCMFAYSGYTSLAMSEVSPKQNPTQAHAVVCWNKFCLHAHLQKRCETCPSIVGCVHVQYSSRQPRRKYRPAHLLTSTARCPVQPVRRSGSLTSRPLALPPAKLWCRTPWRTFWPHSGR